MNPNAANSPTGHPAKAARDCPRAAPMKKSGVTSPPLNPPARVAVVNRSFQNQLQVVTPPGSKLRTIDGSVGRRPVTPNPR